MPDPTPESPLVAAISEIVKLFMRVLPRVRHEPLYIDSELVSKDRPDILLAMELADTLLDPANREALHQEGLLLRSEVAPIGRYCWTCDEMTEGCYDIDDFDGHDSGLCESEPVYRITEGGTP